VVCLGCRWRRGVLLCCMSVVGWWGWRRATLKQLWGGVVCLFLVFFLFFVFYRRSPVTRQRQSVPVLLRRSVLTSPRQTVWYAIAARPVYTRPPTPRTPTDSAEAPASAIAYLWQHARSFLPRIGVRPFSGRSSRLARIELAISRGNRSKVRRDEGSARRQRDLRRERHAPGTSSAVPCSMCVG